MYGTILVVGGGLMFKGADQFLLKRLQAQLPTFFQFMRDQMEVISRPKVSKTSFSPGCTSPEISWGSKYQKHFLQIMHSKTRE